MEWKEILSHVDHTLLKPEATWEDIRQVVEEGIHYGCASVCIPPAYVQRAAEYAAGRVAICTVIGFPNGYNAAPRAKNASASSLVAMPPAAFTFTWGAVCCRSRATSWAVAPPVEKPVEVLM